MVSWMGERLCRVEVDGSRVSLHCLRPGPELKGRQRLRVVWLVKSSVGDGDIGPDAPQFLEDRVNQGAGGTVLLARQRGTID